MQRLVNHAEVHAYVLLFHSLQPYLGMIDSVDNNGLEIVRQVADLCELDTSAVENDCLDIVR